VLRASRRQHTELGHVAPDRVDELDPLARQELVRAMDHPGGLLLSRLDRGHPNGRPGHRLADRGRIRRIVLLPDDVGLT
jgi:hypothetical protein